MPEAKPAPAPQMGEIHAFGICVDCICMRAMKESLEEDGDIVLWGFEVGSSVVVAYWGDKMAGVCSGSLSKDILLLLE